MSGRKGGRGGKGGQHRPKGSPATGGDLDAAYAAHAEAYYERRYRESHRPKVKVTLPKLNWLKEEVK